MFHPSSCIPSHFLDHKKFTPNDPRRAVQLRVMEEMYKAEQCLAGIRYGITVCDEEITDFVHDLASFDEY